MQKLLTEGISAPGCITPVGMAATSDEVLGVDWY